MLRLPPDRPLCQLHRWLGARGADDAFDDAVVAMCRGPKIELGCSPEFLVVHLIQRRVPALGANRRSGWRAGAARRRYSATYSSLPPQAGGAPSPEWAVGKQFCWSTAMSVRTVTRGRSGLARRGSGATSGTGSVAAARRRLRPGNVAGQSDRHPDALLALRVNGTDLTLDYGYPARIIRALPGVHNTKWMGAIDFEAG
jgi:hypothetical protein